MEQVEWLPSKALSPEPSPVRIAEIIRDCRWCSGLNRCAAGLVDQKVAGLNLHNGKLQGIGRAKAAMRHSYTSLLVFILASQMVDATLSKTDAKKAASKTLEEKTYHSGKTVQDRGLVVTDSKAKEIILEHKSYCAKKAQERYFLGDVLGYITPWNNHGYDIAKIFGSKFTTISPVWLQVKRRGKEKFQFTGLHDADQSWMKEVKKNAKNIKIAPRILFEGWTFQDFESVFDSEDEIEELSNNMVQVAKSENFDGFVVEVWSQLGSQKTTDNNKDNISVLVEAFTKIRIDPLIAVGQQFQATKDLSPCLKE
ncbi:Chitinase domain-containing protein 1 [Varanus komodoensis]|nr:Chitinase domain-containing protein 1 [Varanus komodoensis]